MRPARENSGCAYCGAVPSTKDHVVPRALYPSAKATSRVQRITVPACLQCNQSWQDDEVHFRNMLLVAGESNGPVLELWEGEVRRSFGYEDGRRRLRDLVAQMVEVQTDAGPRDVVFPGRDERVMRVVRKVIRGLCYHFKLAAAVDDGRVWADVLKYEVPSGFLSEMQAGHIEDDVFTYRFGLINQDKMHSCWLLSFFEKRRFFGIVYESVGARTRTETENAAAG